jgi:hypothetical protein
MTTQATRVNLMGSKGDTFTATATDDAFTEAVNAESHSLYQILKGQKLTCYSGSYTAGGGMFQIRNTLTGQVKFRGFLEIITEESVAPIPTPIVVEENDIVEIFCEAAPT